MGSIHNRYITVVTIVTLSLAPVFRHHHWVWQLVSRQEATEIVQCAKSDPCPTAKRTVVERYLTPRKSEMRKAHGRPPRRP